MPPRSEPKLRLSVLDRLIDETPRSTVDVEGAWEAPLAEVRERLLRDIEWILNTRRVIEPAPASYPEVSRSLFHFGLPDLTSMPDTLESRTTLARAVEECLEVFEPRLMSIRVTPSEKETAGGRVLRLVIEALLRADPSPERVVFDTLVETAAGKIVVTGAEDA